MLCEVCGRQRAMDSRIMDRGFGDEKVAVCFECARSLDLKGRQIDFSMDFWGEPKRITKCPLCGTTVDSIMSSNYVGCATCYKVFSKDIAELVDSLQGKHLHVGKVPLTIINKSDEESDVASMMNKALTTGDFSIADRVRNHFPGRRQ